MKKVSLIITLLVVVAAVLLSMVSTVLYTEIDGQMVRNTPMPTSTPSVFKITGLVSSEPTKHDGGSGMDTRVTVLTADFAPIDLVAKDVIVLLDASAGQLKVGDKVTLVYCEMDMSYPLQLKYCKYERIIEK